MSAWRHVRAIGLLPAVGAGVVPAVILATSGWGTVGWALDALLAALTVLLGAVHARALDATTKLVVAGPYVPRWVPRRRAWDDFA